MPEGYVITTRQPSPAAVKDFPNNGDPGLKGSGKTCLGSRLTRTESQDSHRCPKRGKERKVEGSHDPYTPSSFVKASFTSALLAAKESANMPTRF